MNNLDNKSQNTNDFDTQNSLDDSLNVDAQSNINDFAHNKQTNITENMVEQVPVSENNINDNFMNRNTYFAQSNTLGENSSSENIPTICDNQPIENNQSDNDESSQNKHCKLDSKLDNRLKNLQFICIPFILAAIIISLFNIGKVRHPLSFLLLAIGLISLAVAYLVRGKAIDNRCGCKNCTQQSKSCVKFAIIFGVAALGLLGTFIYYMVI